MKCVDCDRPGDPRVLRRLHGICLGCLKAFLREEDEIESPGSPAGDCPEKDEAAAARCAPPRRSVL